MTDKFPEAFRRFPDEKKKVKTFQELLDHFKAWNNKGVNTHKQVKALGVEARKMGINDTYQKVDFERNGKWQSRLKDVITGRFVKRDNG